MDTKWYINGLHFKCLQCGKCCSGPQEGIIWVSRPEIKLLAERLGLSTSELRKKYLKRLGFHLSIQENPQTKDCIFLKNINGFKGCTIYDVRPTQCRNWPFWPANLDSPDDWNIAAMKCPGINPVRDKESEIPDGRQRRPVSNGVSKGEFYSFDEIEKIKNQKQWWNNENSLAAASTAAQSRDGLSRHSPLGTSADNGAVNLKICNEVSQIYTWLDSNLKSLNNQCDACGKCCHFDSFRAAAGSAPTSGHKLFVTTPELLYFSKNVKNLRPMSAQSCPYLENDIPPHQFTSRRISLKQHLKPIGPDFKTLHRNVNWCGGKCTVRNYRFAGCRIFFCKADKDLQNNLSEETVKKFKALCDKFSFPYRYIDLTTALNSSEIPNLIES